MMESLQEKDQNRKLRKAGGANFSLNIFTLITENQELA